MRKITKKDTKCIMQQIANWVYTLGDYDGIEFHKLEFIRNDDDPTEKSYKLEAVFAIPGERE